MYGLKDHALEGTFQNIAISSNVAENNNNLASEGAFGDALVSWSGFPLLCFLPETGNKTPRKF